MLLVSGGDVYGGSDAYNRPKCRFIARMMKRFAVDAVALGEMDLNFGLDAIEEDNREFGLNVLCANLFRRGPPEDEPARPADRAGEAAAQAVFPGYRILERGGVRFGVIAVLSPAAEIERTASATGEGEATAYVIEEPGPILAEVLPGVAAQSDFVLLLAHMSKDELSETLAGLEGIDMVILGHSAKPQATADAVMVEGVPAYMASHQGQYIGRVRLSFDEQKRLTATSNEIRLLDESVGSDADMARLVKEFEEENRRLQKELFVKEQFAGSTPGGTRDIYLGLAACQQCHASAFDSYIETRHARAFATLSGLFVHRDSGCVPCHTTGYGERGGFGGARVRGAAVDLVDVQCEACHGPGAEHNRDGAYKARAKESCVKCHTAEQDPDFDFAREWEKIAH